MSQTFFSALLGIILFLFALGQLQRLEFGAATLYAHDLVIGFFLSVWLVADRGAAIKKSLRSLRAGWRSWVPELALLVWIGLGMTLAVFDQFSVIPFLYLGRLGLYSLFALSLWAIFRNNELTVRWLYLASGFGVLLLGFLQYFFIPDTRFLRILAWDDHYYRLISTLFDPAFTGMLFVLVWLSWQQVRHRLPNLVFLLGEILLITGVTLTYSRSSFLALGVAIFGMVVWHWKNKLAVLRLLALAGLCIVQVWLLPTPGGEGTNLQRTSTVVARQDATLNALSDLHGRNWFIGQGLFTPQTTSGHARFPDNLVVLVVTQLGIVGLTLTLLVATRFILFASRHSPVLAISFLALLLHSQFQPTLLQPFIFLWWTGGLLVPELSKAHANRPTA